jgi:hypothetical protein
MPQADKGCRLKPCFDLPIGRGWSSGSEIGEFNRHRTGDRGNSALHGGVGIPAGDAHQRHVRCHPESPIRRPGARCQSASCGGAHAIRPAGDGPSRADESGGSGAPAKPRGQYWQGTDARGGRQVNSGRDTCAICGTGPSSPGYLSLRTCHSAEDKSRRA